MSEPNTPPEGTASELTDQIAQLISRAGELQTAVAEGTRTATEIKAELKKVDALHHTASLLAAEVTHSPAPGSPTSGGPSVGTPPAVTAAR